MTRNRDKQKLFPAADSSTPLQRASSILVLLLVLQASVTQGTPPNPTITAPTQSPGRQQTKKSPTKPKRRKFVRSDEFIAVAKPKLVEHSFRQPYEDMVLAEDTGNLLGYRGNTLDFFSLTHGFSGDPAKTRSLDGNVTSACYKQVAQHGYFVVGCDASGSLSVFSTKNYELVAELPIPDASSILSIASAPDDGLALVYVGVKRGAVRATGVVNLKTNRIVGWLPVFENLYPLGKRLYNDDLRVFSVTDDRQELLMSEGTATATAAEPTGASWGDSSQPLAASLQSAGREQFVVRGTAVLSGDMSQQLATLPVAPACCFRSRAIAVATSHKPQKVAGQPGSTSYQRSLQLFSLKTSASLGREVRLPDSKPQPAKPAELCHRVMVDEQHMRVIYFDKQGISLVPLDRFELQQPPELAATYQGPERLSAATENKFVITAADQRLEVVPKWMPYGMKFDGRTFYWQPTLAQVGVHKVVVGVRYEGVQLGTIERTFDFPMFVDYPSITLPFEAGDFHIHTDNRTVVIWGATDVGRQIAVIDLVTGTIVAQNTAPAWLDSVRIVGDYILVIPEPNTVGTVKILNRDLTPNTLISLPGSIASVQSHKNTLVVQTKLQAHFYDLKTLERTTTIPVAQTPAGGKRHGVSVTPNGIRIDGITYDDAGRTILVQNASAIPSVSPPTPINDPRITGRLPYPIRDRQRAIQLAQEQGRLLGDGRAIRLRLEEQPTSNRNQRRKQREPLLKASVYSIGTRRSAPHASQYLSPGRSSYKLLVRNDTAYIVSRKSLFRWKVPTRPSDADSKPRAVAPLRLVLAADQRTSRLVLGTTKSTVLKHSAIGGTAPYQFAVAHSHSGFSIDPDTGAVTINAKAMHREAAETLARYLQRRGRPRPKASFKRPLVW